MPSTEESYIGHGLNQNLVTKMGSIITAVTICYSFHAINRRKLYIGHGLNQNVVTRSIRTQHPSCG